MKFFVLLLLLLLAVTYKVASNNGQELALAEASNDEIENEMKKIDLKKITIKTNTALESDTSSPRLDYSQKHDIETDPLPNFEEGAYSYNYGESTQNLIDAKYSEETELKNVPEIPLNRGDMIRLEFEQR